MKTEEAAAIQSQEWVVQAERAGDSPKMKTLGRVKRGIYGWNPVGRGGGVGFGKRVREMVGDRAWRSCFFLGPWEAIEGFK